MNSSKQQPAAPYTVSMPVQYLKGVGPAKAKIFAEMGVQTVGDLLEYFPRDWVFAPEPVKINQIQPGREVSFTGLVESTDLQTFRRPAIFAALLSDDPGICRIIWFNAGDISKQL